MSITSVARPAITGNTEMNAGGLKIEVVEPFKTLRVTSIRIPIASWRMTFLVPVVTALIRMRMTMTSRGVVVVEVVVEWTWTLTKALTQV